MPVPSVITDLSVIAASNSPAGSDSIGTSLDDYLRSVQAIIKREQAQGAAIASSATTAIGGNTDGNYLHITGTMTITSFGTVAAGISRTVVFDGVLTLTHSASLILPGGSNITTAAGDAAEFVSEGSGVWRCVAYVKAAGFGTAAYYNVGTGANKIPVFDASGNFRQVGSDGITLAHFGGASYAARIQSIASTGVLFEATDDVESTFHQLWLGGSSVGIKLLGTTYFNLTSSSATVSQPIGLGYGTGAGGSVTQATSKGTAVTLNKPCGQITMNNASLAAGALVTFAVNSSLVAQYDVPVIALGNVGTGATYEAWVSYVATGVFYITLKNNSGGALGEAVKINFSLLKGAVA